MRIMEAGRIPKQDGGSDAHCMACEQLIGISLATTWKMWEESRLIWYSGVGEMAQSVNCWVHSVIPALGRCRPAGSVELAGSPVYFNQ